MGEICRRVPRFRSDLFSSMLVSFAWTSKGNKLKIQLTEPRTKQKVLRLDCEFRKTCVPQVRSCPPRKGAGAGVVIGNLG